MSTQTGSVRCDVYNVMEGVGPVSLSAGLLLQYPEKVEQKHETTSYHFKGATNTIILQKKCKKKSLASLSLS